MQPVQPAPQELPYQQQPYQQGYPAQQPQYPAQPTQPPSVVYDAEVVDPERPNN